MKTQDGAPYTRLPAIEAAIDAALVLDEATVVRRAGLADGHPEHLPMECVVHLVRHAFRKGERRLGERLYHGLVRRCAAQLVRALPESRRYDATSLRGEVLGRLGELFARDRADDGVLDYFEIRFRGAFSMLRIEVLRAELKLAKRFEPERPKASRRDGGKKGDKTDEPPAGEVTFASLQNVASFARSGQEGDVGLARLVGAIAELPEDERQAVTLHHIYGIPIESEDPRIETVARRCGVTPRTIRNRLQKAAQKLSRFHEDP